MFTGPLDIDNWIFLSTSPLRGTTKRRRQQQRQRSISIHVPLAGDDPHGQEGGNERDISIHVPLAGDDHCQQKFLKKCKNFYPRPPCGGRPSRSTQPPGRAKFLSTSPLRGTTANVTENTVYFPAHLSQQDTAYKNTLRFCAVCGHFRGASAQSALKMLCSPVRTARRFSAR